MNAALLSDLRSELPPTVIIDDADVLASHASDWSKSAALAPPYVLRPETSKQVSIILRLCNQYKQAVVTQGGLTGLSGGATPAEGEIALSLSRLQGVLEVDAKGQTITVRSGTSLQAIQEAADAAGFKFALDLGARGNCSIGGNLATNAGGNQVIKYGMARAQVLGLEAVRADGTIVRAMNSMLKDNAGYDLKQLFIGSEGTLGVITECVLRLHPKPRSVNTALCGCATFDNAVALLGHVQSQLGAVSSFEVMWRSYFDYAIENVAHTRNPMKEAHEFYVLVEQECDGTDHAQEHFLTVLSEAMDQGVTSDIIVAQSAREANELWDIRDAIADILSQIAPLANFDIGVPIKYMEEFIDRVDRELNEKYSNLTFFVFGHLGDGNLHLCASTGNADDAKSIYAHTYQIASLFSASVTAEHGVGTQKAKYLHYTRSKEELAMMRDLKRALDPNNILNPGRVIDIG
ncbi:MAG: FAD-binding oxidoreductase [Pseudomonadales bacterium]